MATKPKEGAAKSKPSPTTTTPSSQKKRSGTTETTTEDATTSTAPEKPVPNYLRPTISSCRNTRQLPIRHQHCQAESTSPVAGKPLASRNPAEKASSRSSSQPKDRICSRPISQLPRPSSVSPKATKKASSSEPAKSCSRASSKGASSGGATKRKEAKAVTQLEMKKEERTVNSGNESEVRKLNFPQGKTESSSSKENEESSCKENEETKGKNSPTLAYNAMVDERRNKVKALVGAFETVSPRKGEEAKGCETSPRGQQKKVKGGETGQDNQQQQQEETGGQQIAEKVKGIEASQYSQQKDVKHKETGQESQWEETDQNDHQIAEEVKGIEASQHRQQKDVKNEKTGQESQQEETDQTNQHDAEGENNNKLEVDYVKRQEQEEEEEEEKRGVLTGSKQNRENVNKELSESTKEESEAVEETIEEINGSTEGKDDSAAI